MMRNLLMLTGALLLAGCADSTGSGDPKDTAPPSACEMSTPMPAQNPPESALYTLDPLGPFVDVSCDWQRYQPADAFCVQLSGPEFTPGGQGMLTDGRDPVCAFSGFAASDTGLYRFSLPTPILCAGCRRMFLDFTQIPEDRPAENVFYPHGHAFYRIMSFNPSYIVEPSSHSPNTKNFYNDKLVSPPGTPVEQMVGIFDTHFMSYVTSTRFFIHTAIQGGHYIGPWYVNRAGERIHGVYVDVNVGDATSMGDPNADAFRYMAAYNSGETTCYDNLSPMTSGGNLLYGGCVDRIGSSTTAWDPFQ